MAQDSQGSAAISSIQTALDRAFSGTVYLVSSDKKEELIANYRDSFEIPGSLLAEPDKYEWHKVFQSMIEVTYESQGITTTVLDAIPESVKKWLRVREQCEEISENLRSVELTDVAVTNVQVMSGKTFDLINGDSVEMQQHVLTLYATGSPLVKVVEDQLSDMKTIYEAAQESIAKVEAVVETSRKCWVLCAKGVAGSLGRDGYFSNDWFLYLNQWSDLVNMYDNSLPLLRRAVDRFMGLRNQMADKVPALLAGLPALCFDLHGDLLAGAVSSVSADNTAMHEFQEKLRSSLWNVPSTSIDDNLGKNPTKQGYVSATSDNVIQNSGDDPASAWMSDEENIQVGVSRIGFSNAIEMRLEVTDPQDARRHWKSLSPSSIWEPWETTLSWIRIPGGLRDHVQFSWTTFGHERSEQFDSPEVRAPGMKDEPSFYGRHADEIWSWTVKFPRAFTSDDVTVRPWFRDMSVFPPRPYAWESSDVYLETSDIQRDSFRITIRTTATVRYLHIGYAAYENGAAGIAGFHAEKYGMEINQDGSGKKFAGNGYGRPWPVFYPFPPGKFRRRPAAVPMISAFSLEPVRAFRAETQIAVSRDGVIVQGRPESGYHGIRLWDMNYQVLVIANE